MIRYALVCEKGHDFEGWFSNSAAFDAQSQAGEVTCPHCGSARVEKALMAPNVTTSRRKAQAPRAEASTQSGQAESVPAPAQEPATVAQTPEMAKLRVLARRLRDHVKENADYVGDRFADEARKIHYEEATPRGIYGEATAEEARDLHEEGIDFHPLPVLPEDKN